MPPESAETWDAQADTFDDEPDHGLHDPGVRQAWLGLMREVLPPAPARIADLGCGTGSLAVLLAREGYDVVGLDASSRMLELARAKAASSDVAVTLVLGDANAPDLGPDIGPGTFDVVLVRHVLWAMTDPADAVRRWAELLAPAGRLVLVEGRWHTGAGLAADQTLALVRAIGRRADLRELPEPELWGGPTGDDRYVVVSAG